MGAFARPLTIHKNIMYMFPRCCQCCPFSWVGGCGRSPSICTKITNTPSVDLSSKLVSKSSLTTSASGILQSIRARHAIRQNLMISAWPHAPQFGSFPKLKRRASSFCLRCALGSPHRNHDRLAVVSTTIRN